MIGQTLVATRNGSTPTDAVAYSPWFERQGDAVTSCVDVISITGADTTFEVTLLEKNRDVTGDGTANGAAASVTAAGQTSFRRTACKELLRYKFVLKAGGVAADSAVFCVFRMLAPQAEVTGA